ncbi:MAG: 30S ribosomal protein S5 [Dehalococcoidales bacterium]|jgi:small subunit ribosomal protein S5|nr:30S ribosomal protein S5 [Dehalococcoidales bacterium]MDP7524981.1 30S ribosomal protein S5 [Dehalococcoidales bacterium]|tara:strand:- start:472 stop:1035 length:564 start_codon:yes stop_codon:yes gene_type:complete
MKERLSTIDPTELLLNDKLIDVNRVAKVMKGGKRLSFSALAVTGDGNGHVGIGLGKANEVPVAINKANATARRHLIKVPLVGTTIPYEIKVKFGAAQIFLKPAPPGTGIIAGSSIRPVLEAVGIKDVFSKSMGSPNRINVAKATVLALSQLKDPRWVVAKRKGIPFKTAEEAPPVAAITEGEEDISD